MTFFLNLTLLFTLSSFHFIVLFLIGVLLFCFINNVPVFSFFSGLSELSVHFSSQSSDVKKLLSTGDHNFSTFFKCLTQELFEIWVCSLFPAVEAAGEVQEHRHQPHLGEM